MKNYLFSKDYYHKGFKMLVIGAIGSGLNWIILYFLVSDFNWFYLTAEILATIIAFGLNYNLNIIWGVVQIKKNQPMQVNP